MVQIKKTDNDFLRDKVDLRIAHLPVGDIRVLDCFAGRGIVWSAVRKLSGRNIKTLPIDIRNDIFTFHLSGRNEEFLSTMDLSKFNVVDLDAYGVPHEQLRILFNRGYAGVVFVTFIQSLFGMMPKSVLRDVGFSDAMMEKCPSLSSRRGWDFFRQWLALNKVRLIFNRSKNRKHYLCFTLNDVEARGADCGRRSGETVADPV